MMTVEKPNICGICGGVQRIEFVMGFEEGRPYDLRIEHRELLPEGEWRICPGHPEPAPKHNGKLDERGDRLVRLMGDDGEEFQGNRDVVIMNGRHDEGIVLHPTQALSLLNWLIQEKPELERLAKEQGSE